MVTTTLRRVVVGALLGLGGLSNVPAWAQLVIEPPDLSVVVPRGAEEARTVTMTNTGSEALAFCLSFDRPLQRAGELRLIGTLGGGSTPCGTYGEVLGLIAAEAVPGNWDPYGATMTSDGRLFVADYIRAPSRTHELTPDLELIRSFAHPIVEELESNPVTTGVTYNADTGTLWWLNIEAEGFEFHRALLLEGDLDGVATGRRIELPVAETAPPPHETGRPVGLAYDAATKRYYYTDIANDDVWAVDTLGNVIDGYPVQPEAYPGAALGFGLNTLAEEEGGTEGLRLELIISPAGPPPPRIAVIDRFGGDLGAGTTLETPLPDLTGGTGGGGASGEPVRSRLDPNGVLYVPFSNFDTAGVAALRPNPLPPSWLVVSEWDGTLAPGESREVTLTFRPGQRAVGEYTAVLQAFTAETSEAVEVPLVLTVTQGTVSEEELAEVPSASSLSVYPNPLGEDASATVALTLDAAAEARVVVYDVLGRAVAMLHEGRLKAGAHRFDLSGRALPSGVYLVRVEVGSEAVVRRLTLVK